MAQYFAGLLLSDEYYMYTATHIPMLYEQCQITPPCYISWSILLRYDWQLLKSYVQSYLKVE